MTGRGGTRPATTPQGRKSCVPLASHAENQPNSRTSIRGKWNGRSGRRRDPPSDAAAGTPVSCGRISRASPQVSGASWKRTAIGSSASALAPPQPL